MHRTWHPSQKDLQNQLLGSKHSEKSYWTAAILYRHKGPWFLQWTPISTERTCLKTFSTACHHWQRFRFDLKLFHSLRRNLLASCKTLQRGFLGFCLNYECPESTEAFPSCLRCCVFLVTSGSNTLHCRQTSPNKTADCKHHSSLCPPFFVFKWSPFLNSRATLKTWTLWWESCKNWCWLFRTQCCCSSREPVTQEQHFCVEKQQRAGSACAAKNARGGLQVGC